MCARVSAHFRGNTARSTDKPAFSEHFVRSNSFLDTAVAEIRQFIENGSSFTTFVGVPAPTNWLHSKNSLKVVSRMKDNCYGILKCDLREKVFSLHPDV